MRLGRRERPEVAAVEAHGVDAGEERRLARPALRQALHAERGVDGDEDVAPLADGLGPGRPRLPSREGAERREVERVERVVLAGGPEPNAVQEDEEGAGHSASAMRASASAPRTGTPSGPE